MGELHTLVVRKRHSGTKEELGCVADASLTTSQKLFLPDEVHPPHHSLCLCGFFVLYCPLNWVC